MSRGLHWTDDQLKAFKARTGVEIKPDNKVPKPNKFGAKKMVWNGRKYDSAKEAKRAEELHLLQQAGEISGLQEQARMSLYVSGQLICHYIPDFRYHDKSGKEVIEDVKGYKRGAAYDIFRLKARLVKALCDIEIKEI